MGFFNFGRSRRKDGRLTIEEMERIDKRERAESKRSDKEARIMDREFSRDIKELRRKEKLEPIKERGIVIGHQKKTKPIDIRGIQKTGFQLGQQVGQFGQAAPEESFSFQEDVLRQTVGGRGEKIWGNIRQPVTINNDLNARQSGRPGTDETAAMFGFGGR